VTFKKVDPAWIVHRKRWKNEVRQDEPEETLKALVLYYVGNLRFYPKSNKLLSNQSFN
jgi:uncharacterized protein (UPF0297 family)